MHSDHLFELIKSLNKTEKRYFKLMASRHTIGDENNYIILFDFLDGIETYDEKLIFIHFKKESFINNFSITKKRLYDRILAALDNYYSHSSIDSQLFKLLNSADILSNKALYDQSRKVLVSAQKLALKHQRYLILLEIQKRSDRLLENTRYENTSVEKIRELKARKSDIIQHVVDHFELWSLKSELFIELAIFNDCRNKEHQVKIEQIYFSLKETFNPSTLSIENLYLYYHIESAYYFAVQDFDACKSSLASNIDLFENHPVFLEQQPHSYFSVLTNIIFIHEQLMEFNEADFLLLKLKKFQKTYSNHLTEDMEIKLFSSISSISLSSFYRLGSATDSIEFVNNIKNGLEKFENKIPSSRRIFLHYQCALVLISTGNHTEALDSINQLLNTTDRDVDESIIGYAHFLELIIHIELKNIRLLPHALRNTERFLKSRNLLHPFENLLLRFINKIIKTENTFDIQLIWESFYEELVEFRDANSTNKTPNFFDFESWTKAKIEHKNFHEIAKQRYTGLAS